MWEEDDINTKLKILLITTLSLILLSISISFFLDASAKKYIGKIFEAVVDNKYATSEDLAVCSLKNIDCINTAYSYLSSGVKLKVTATSQSELEVGKVETELSTIRGYIHGKKYKKAYVNTLSIIDEVNKTDEEYIKKYSKDFLSLRELTKEYGPVNYYLIKDWAVVNVYSKGLDVGNIICKKNTVWQIYRGPFTSFEKGDLFVPNTLLPKINLYLDKPILNYFNSSDFSDPISNLSNQVNTANEEVLGSNELPYGGEHFEISLEFIDDKPFYVVTTYTSDGKNEKEINAANSWLKELGVQPNNANTIYKSDSLADVE